MNGKVVWVAVAMLSLGGCFGRDVGESCKRSGDGFLARDPCRTMCLAFPVRCPDGASVIPKVCAGQQSCVHGECPSGQECLRVNVDRSFCVPRTICESWTGQHDGYPVLIPDHVVHEKLFGRKPPLQPVP